MGATSRLIFALSLPAATALAGLVWLGPLDTGPAIAAGAVAVLIVGALATAWAMSLGAIRDAVEGLGRDGPPEAEPGPARPARWFAPSADALWPAALRVRRAWRERVAAVEARLAGANAVTATLPDPLILIDSHRRVVGANAAAAEFVGAVAESRDLASSLRNPLVLAAADAVLRGEAARIVEFAVAVPVARLLQARFARIEGPPVDGAVAILTLHDITALKQAEQMRADFVANAGHELKTPLATLIGFIETLLGPAREDAAARERFLGIMREQAGRMARLVDDLLSLSRIELNEHVAPTERVSLPALIETVAATLELRAAERGVHVVLDLPDHLPDVLGDHDELAQVFQNLLDNAIKYGRPRTEVTVSAKLDGAGAATPLVGIAVSDHGDGIAAEHLPRLTERFYRVDTARSRELGGTGLGLAIVKHILNRHRGRLEIASMPGSGSVFTACLRPAPPEVEEPAGEAAVD